MDGVEGMWVEWRDVGGVKGCEWRGYGWNGGMWVEWRGCGWSGGMWVEWRGCGWSVGMWVEWRDVCDVELCVKWIECLWEEGIGLGLGLGGKNNKNSLLPIAHIGCITDLIQTRHSSCPFTVILLIAISHNHNSAFHRMSKL